MSFLPIVERELRVAARRSSTYQMRFLAGLVVMGLWLVLLMGRRPASAGQLGHHIFVALGVLALGFAMLAGVFLTSDCLSEEKRQGTLGLLFLTDLKGYDVVLGKVAAASVHAFFGLLAIFPILGLPLLMGGVSGAEFWRIVLLLTVTLFFSLALGLAISSLSYDARHSISGTFMLMLMFAGTCPALWWLQHLLVRVRFLDPLLFPSPGFAYLKAFDLGYRSGGGTADFWWSLATILVISLGGVAFASVVLPRVWQQGGEDRSSRAWLRPQARFRRSPSGAGVPPATRASRPRTSSGAPTFAGETPAAAAGTATPLPWSAARVVGNPYYWLTSRSGLRGILAGALLRVLVSIWFIFLLVSLLSPKHEQAFITCLFTAYGMHLLVKILLAAEASRRVSEDRQSGALELILVTPLPIPVILAGHRQALKELFRGSVLFLSMVNLGMMLTVVIFGKRLHMDWQDRVVFSELFAGGLLMLWVDFYALKWIGMWAGLTARRHHRAVAAALGKVIVIPWAAIFLLVFLERGMNSAWQAGLVFAVWFGLGLVVSLVSGASAKKKLKSQFRAAALH